MKPPVSALPTGGSFYAVSRFFLQTSETALLSFCHLSLLSLLGTLGKSGRLTLSSPASSSGTDPPSPPSRCVASGRGS